MKRQGLCRYLTTENAARFKASARIFLNEDVDVKHVDLE